MSASLTPSPKMQFFDANGDPLVGGKLYTYAAGTTTPLATYTDSTGATPNANPVVMNARGEASVWLGTSAYYFELKDSSGSLIWTADNITGQITPSLVQSGAYQWLTSVSGADTITAAASPVPSAYAAGQTFRFVSAGANTGAATLNVSSLGAKSITKNGTTALAAGDIPSGAVVSVVYDGTQFQIASVSTANLAPKGAATASGLTQATSRVLGRISASTGAIEELTLSQVLDLVGSAAQGDILYRDASGWARLAAGTSGYFLKTQGAGANPTWAAQATAGITLGTPVASTSGTAIDFTGIPAGTKRVTINLSGVSTNGSSDLMIQIGDSGGVETSGYAASSGYVQTATPGATAYSSGFGVAGTGTAAAIMDGSIILSLENSTANTWCATGSLTRSDVTQCCYMAGVKSLSPGPLDRVRITTAGGTAAFDAGEINISYE